MKGLAVTLKTMTSRTTTQQYPDVAPELPPRSRGVIALSEENCTVCMLCARECPDWCIYIDSHKEEVAVPGAARPRQRNVLDKFDIDFSLCMYCGICIEVCPFDALYWSPEFEYAEYDIKDLLHDKDHLGQWMATVPPPPAHDPNGEPAKEETAAARKAAAARPARSIGTPRRRPGPGVVTRPSRRGGPVTGADVLLLALGAVAVGAGVLVVTTKHLVRAGLYLVVCLGALAGDFLVLSAELVAWVQVLIYVGAVVVLLLFAVMLTRAPIGASDDLDRPGWPAALIGGGAGLGLTVLLVDAYRWSSVALPAAGTAERLGEQIFQSWVLPFEVLSVLLLSALVGAIVLSRPDIGRPAPQRDATAAPDARVDVEPGGRR